MTMAAYGTLPALARRGTLVAVFGPRAGLTDWLSMFTSDCPQKNQKGVARACGAVMPDLRNLR